MPEDAAPPVLPPGQLTLSFAERSAEVEACRPPAVSFLSVCWPWGFPAQPCLCGALVDPENAVPVMATDHAGKTVFAGLRHPECARLGVIDVEVAGERL